MRQPPSAAASSASLRTGTLAPRTSVGAWVTCLALTSDFHQANSSSCTRLPAPALPIAVVTSVRVLAESSPALERSTHETIFAGRGAAAASATVLSLL